MLDLIYLVDEPMGTNHAQRSRDFLAAAGGGATNAAVAFAALGGAANAPPIFSSVILDGAYCMWAQGVGGTPPAF